MEEYFTGLAQADHDAALRHLAGLRSHLGALYLDGQPLLVMFKPQLRTIESAIRHAARSEDEV